jgi:hypothetical protein
LDKYFQAIDIMGYEVIMLK